MTVREFRNRDLPELLGLLKTQDERASQRSMTPEGRSIEDLALELGELSPYTELVPLVLEQHGQLAAYVALCNYDGEAFLEGPLMRPELGAADVAPLLERAVSEAKVRGYSFVEAFVDEENVRAQDALAASAFEPFRTTYIYEFRRGSDLTPLSPSRFRFEQGEVDVGVYRDLYRETSDNWATRLAWRDEDLRERFSDPQVSLTLVYQDDRPVGHLELERLPDEGYAEVAYFGVLPAARGQKLGRELLLRGLHEAFAAPDVELVLARAHDDERAASVTLESVGFLLSHGVVAYTLELK
ncbi:MAG: Acetyltransferase [uncultured Truepera sp.]|uniref:Acetyltransferase n=1 Tax=uncultured Truepera sp. TaxID=543023 RepID=A0A6J4VYG8_9DEIN|nr:MAG: Acetyltransferase [uncultured Truepera sp.]